MFNIYEAAGGVQVPLGELPKPAPQSQSTLIQKLNSMKMVLLCGVQFP
jgi:hypothetical protein